MLVINNLKYCRNYFLRNLNLCSQIRVRKVSKRGTWFEKIWKISQVFVKYKLRTGFAILQCWLRQTSTMPQCESCQQNKTFQNTLSTFINTARKHLQLELFFRCHCLQHLWQGITLLTYLSIWLVHKDKLDYVSASILSLYKHKTNIFYKTPGEILAVWSF